MFAYGWRKKNIMWGLLYYHYLPQYVIMVDIGNRFINIQGIKQYLFPLFLLCAPIIADKRLVGCFGWQNVTE